MHNQILRMSNLRLCDVGGFHDMSISFDAGLNIICGANGVGKTTILDAIGAVFVSQPSNSILRRRAGAESGKIEYRATYKNDVLTGAGILQNFYPSEQAQAFGHHNEAVNNLIYLKSNRDFSYSRIDGVLRDPDKQYYNTQVEAVNGISVVDIKQWFGNRYLMEHHGHHWPAYRHENLRIANTFFSLLDPAVNLSHVDTSTFEIILDTPSGKIPFEYMSAGFRSSYALIFGILKEIEFRRLDVAANEFQGIILIDELDLHLHPTWHGPMLEALTSAYPLAQFILSTHSPHIVQYARPKNVIAIRRGSSAPMTLEGVDEEFGFIGWTVEEILRDIMGMEDPRPPAFVRIMNAYESAVTGGGSADIEAAKDKVLRCLHPSSIMRQIIEIESI